MRITRVAPPPYEKIQQIIEQREGAELFLSKFAKPPIHIKEGRFILNSEPNNMPSQEGYQEMRTYLESVNNLLQEIRKRSSQQVDTLPRPEVMMGNPNSDVTTASQQLQLMILHESLKATGAVITVVSKDEEGWWNNLWLRDRFITGETQYLFPKVDGVDNKEWMPQFYLNQIGPHETIRAATLAYREHLSKNDLTDNLGYFIEGGDVIQHFKSNTVFVGIEPLPNSEEPDPVAEKAAKELAEKLGMSLVMVPKTNPTLYHLDTFMGVLPDGSAVVIPNGTTPEAMATIKKTIGTENLLELHPDMSSPGLNLITNFITINGNVFTGTPTRELDNWVKQRGFYLVPMPYDAVDSGPRCLTAPTIQTRNAKDPKTNISAIDPRLDDALRGDNWNPPSQISVPTSVVENSAPLRGKGPTNTPHSNHV